MDTNDRKRIGLILNYPRNWLGGIYYILNIIKSFESLDDRDRPFVYLFYNELLSDLVDSIEYPLIETVPWQFPTPARGYVCSFLTRKNLFSDDILKKFGLDGLYPVNDYPTAAISSSTSNSKVAAWYPDLQHKFYPKFFDKRRLIIREIKTKLMLKHATDLVVSSEDVRSKFHKLYRVPRHLKIHVVKFVSLIEQGSYGDIEVIRAKYGIPNDYFMVSNQILEHKNLASLVEAIALLKKSGRKTQLVVTGKDQFNNIDNSEYLRRLRDLIERERLQDLVSFLGVIPRAHQLCLMKHSSAVVQPSLFEGWSTLIEDAKSLQVPVLASEIDVHVEQLGESAIYFDPLNPQDIADKLERFRANDAQVHEPYEQRVKTFSQSFLSVFKCPQE